MSPWDATTHHGMRRPARGRPTVPSIEPRPTERGGKIAARDANEPLHPKAIGGAFDPPSIGGYGAPEQRARDRLLGRAFEKRVSGAQFENPLRRTPFAGQKRCREPALPGEEAVVSDPERQRAVESNFCDGGPANHRLTTFRKFSTNADRLDRLPQDGNVAVSLRVTGMRASAKAAASPILAS